MVEKKILSERDIGTKCITLIIIIEGWDVLSKIRGKVSCTKGLIIVRGLLLHISLNRLLTGAYYV